MSEWQPIETAPNDQRLLLYMDDRVMKGVVFGKVRRFINSGDVIVFAEGFNGDWRVSHWMPIPAPPALAKQTGE